MSRQTLTFTAGLIRRHRRAIGSTWRKLNPGQHALLVLAYLRKGETFAELAAGFEVGTATAQRYIQETVALLAARAPKLRQAVRDAKKAGHAYVVLDGTLERPVRGDPVDRRSSPAPAATSCGCPARCPDRCTTRRPSGCDTESHMMSECADWRAGP